jgi:membrane dipeptidase
MYYNYIYLSNRKKAMPEFDMVDETQIIPKNEFYYPFKLTKEDEERAKNLLKESLVISFHDHPFLFPKEEKHNEEYFRTGRLFFGYEGLKLSGLKAVFAGIHYFCRVFEKNPEIGRVWHIEDLIYSLGMLTTDILKQKDNKFIMAKNSKEIIQAYKSGKISIIPTTESIAGIIDDLDLLDVLYGLGLRVACLTYYDQNHIGGGENDPGAGLTEYGMKVIERMNELGMMIDLSHTNKRTTLEAIEASKVPCVVSHSLSATISGISSYKTDEEIIALAEKEGIFGVKVAAKNLKKDKDILTIEDALDHIDYIVKLVGSKHVVIGPDTVFKGRGNVKGIENPTQFINIIRGLIERGYSDEEIKKIIGQNVINLMKKIERNNNF